MCVLQGDLTLRWRRFFGAEYQGDPGEKALLLISLNVNAKRMQLRGRRGAWGRGSAAAVAALGICTFIPEYCAPFLVFLFYLAKLIFRVY